jgi:ABC-type multidrug transport system fused ATPase/permease subunit
MSWVKNNEWLKPSNDEINWSQLVRFGANYRPSFRQLGAAISLAVVSSSVLFFIPSIFKLAQQSVVARNLSLLSMAVALYAGIVGLQSGTAYVIRRLHAKISIDLNRRLVLQYYGKLLNLHIASFLSFKQNTNMFQRLIDAMAVTSMATEVLAQSMQHLVVVAVTLIAVAHLSAISCIVVVLAEIALFTFVSSMGPELRRKRQELLATNYPLVSKMLEIIDGLLVIKALSASVRVTNDIQTLVDKKREAELGETGVDIRATQGAQLISSVALVLVVGIGFYLAIRGDLQYSDAFALYILVNMSLGPVADLAKHYQQLSSLSVNVRNYYQVLDMRDEESEGHELASLKPADYTVAAASNSVAHAAGEELFALVGEHVTESRAGASPTEFQTRAPLPTSDARHEQRPYLGRIQFEDVTFAYPGSDPVIEGLNIEIMPGEKISLIGRSGVGKTTLLRLLLGFLTPQKGRIVVDGQDISTLSKNAYRRQIGVVSQSDIMFAVSLRENLLFGLRETRSDSDILHVLESVNLREDVESCKNGLDTLYSEHLFSGGQKQRLFIARALLRQPSIVLLDEPTSALDFENEAKVLQALESLAANRSTISIAHRLSTVRSSNRIVILENKRILATGSHEELYQTNDYYLALCKFNSFIM